METEQIETLIDYKIKGRGEKMSSSFLYTWNEADGSVAKVFTDRKLGWGIYVYNKDGVRLAMTDKDGQIVASYEYDAWGNVLKSEAKGIAADNPFGYAGYMYDKEIGMYYLIARYYNPEHGVFLSVDPDPGDEDDPVTQNGYTYGDNNPVMMVDPDGHWVWFAVNAGFAAYDGYKAYKSGKG